MAKNGRDAVESVKSQSIDLILMAIRMPIMDGYEASEIIKSFTDIPIIALTASVMRDEYDRIKSSHFDGYLSKPVLKSNLMTELCKFLPYERSEFLTASKPEGAVFNSNEWQAIPPEALIAMKTLVNQCSQARSSNSMFEMKQFAESVLSVGKRFGLNAVSDYGERLGRHVDSFDITEIKHSLDEYLDLYKAVTGDLTQSAK